MAFVGRFGIVLVWHERDRRFTQYFDWAKYEKLSAEPNQESDKSHSDGWFGHSLVAEQYTGDLVGDVIYKCRNHWFKNGIGIILGANLGTTLTGWLVSLLGFKFHIQTAILPF